jgi:hypothetical protein
VTIYAEDPIGSSDTAISRITRSCCAFAYLRYCLTLRDLEELMAERGLRVDHSNYWPLGAPLCS